MNKDDCTTQKIVLSLDHSQQGQFLSLPFDVPEGVEELCVEYAYERYERVENGPETERRQVSIIDLGLFAPDGEQAGASGSNKPRVRISAAYATPGYRAQEPAAGRWQIIVGAYHVAPGGVDVTYTITCLKKRRRLLRGDLHMHTTASDGVLTVEELASHARAHGLDFVAITDHNVQYEHRAAGATTGVTIIPGVEWTLYQGHANFLGLRKPLAGSYVARTAQDVRKRFEQARAAGAVICVNHPCDFNFAFQFPLDELDFDCIEVWNGPMRHSNLDAIGLWQRLLACGRRVAACGGSDYHRDGPFQFLGGPTTCVWADSASARDILDAVRRGRGYIVHAPNGPMLASMKGVSPGEPDADAGDSIPWHEDATLEVAFEDLEEGDELLTLSARGQHTVHAMSADGDLRLRIPIDGPGFAALMLTRSLFPGLPRLPVLLSNPVYFR